MGGEWRRVTSDDGTDIPDECRLSPHLLPSISREADGVLFEPCFLTSDSLACRHCHPFPLLHSLTPLLYCVRKGHACLSSKRLSVQKEDAKTWPSALESRQYF